MDRKLYRLHEVYNKHSYKDTGIRLGFQGLDDCLLLCGCGACRVRDSSRPSLGQDVASIHGARYLGRLNGACTPALRRKIAAYKKFIEGFEFKEIIK